jgi:two-component system chemotaxis response regulator CheY
MRILDVGQCGFDGPRMEELWREALGAQVDAADSAEQALECVRNEKYDLVLVNRILAFDDSPGLEVVKQLLHLHKRPPVMLVSDRPDAQDAAVALGAVRGFGKASLGEQSTLDLVSRVAAGDA